VRQDKGFDEYDMSNSEFLLWYINKVYLFTGTKIKYKFMVGEEPLTLYELKENIQYSLNISDSDKKTSSELINKWYSDLKYHATEDVMDFIKFKYKVKLGPRYWEIVNLKGKKVSTKDIQLDLKGKYDEEFLKTVVDKWFENEVIRVSEDMMLRFD
jgi:hypothetical protein